MHLVTASSFPSPLLYPFSFFLFFPLLLPPPLPVLLPVFNLPLFSSYPQSFLSPLLTRYVCPPPLLLLLSLDPTLHPPYLILLITSILPLFFLMTSFPPFLFPCLLPPRPSLLDSTSSFQIFLDDVGNTHTHTLHRHTHTHTCESAYRHFPSYSKLPRPSP